MHISATGVPQGRAVLAQAAIRGVLLAWGSDDLSVIAHRLNSGEWSLMVFDGVHLSMLKDGLHERVLLALSEL